MIAGLVSLMLGIVGIIYESKRIPPENNADGVRTDHFGEQLALSSWGMALIGVSLVILGLMGAA